MCAQYQTYTYIRIKGEWCGEISLKLRITDDTAWIDANFPVTSTVPAACELGRREL